MKAIKYVLVILQLILFANAVGGAAYGLAGAPGVSLEWLEGTPFHSYFVPSLILLVAVGGSLLASSMAWLLESRLAPWTSVAAGAVMLVWVVVQVAMISLNSPLQPICFVLGLVLIVLAVIALRKQRVETRDRGSRLGATT